MHQIIWVSLIKAFYQGNEINFSIVENTLGDPLSESDPLVIFKNLIDSPPESHIEYTRIKKDIFHAFHMIPIPINHSMCPGFLHALQDHMMQWDPASKSAVDKVCHKFFNLTFDQMLARNPCFIAEHTPSHVLSPSILVPAIEYVYKTFGMPWMQKQMSHSSISKLGQRQMLS